MILTEQERGMVKRIPGYEDIRAKVSEIIINEDFQPRIWLDTGCGSGGLVRENVKRFSQCQFILADPSEENISSAKEQMHGEQRCLYVSRSTEKLNFGDETLDVITAMFSHHYYSDIDSKKEAIMNCARMLKRGGLYIMTEHVSHPENQKESDDEWRSFMSAQGLPSPFIDEMIVRRGREYFPLSESAHIELLKECGLNPIDVFWRSCSDIGIVSRKM